MANTIQIKRTQNTTLPTGVKGELIWKDNHVSSGGANGSLHIGDANDGTLVNIGGAGSGYGPSYITPSANNASNETVYPLFIGTAAAIDKPETDTGFTYNPSTGMLTTAGVTATFTGDITGDVTGNADSATTAAANTGNMTGTGSIATGVTATTQSAGTNNTSIATTAYVDNAADTAAQGLVVKTDVVAATTAKVTIAAAAAATTLTIADGEFGYSDSGNTLTIDGVSVANGERILIKDDMVTNSVDNGRTNGIYTVSNPATAGSMTFTRATDMDATGDQWSNAFVFVTGGDENVDTSWVCTMDTDAPTVGTTEVTFAQFNSAGRRNQIHASGAGMTIKDTNGTGSASTGGYLKLQADDGAAIADNHRLGVIEFSASEDANNTLVVGAKIQALADATWSGTENGAALEFYTTDADAAQSKVLTLDSDKLATFAGAVTTGGAISAGANNISSTGTINGTTLTFGGSGTQSTLPSGRGSNGQFLQTNGSGTLAWASATTSDVDVSVANLEARLPQIDTSVTIGDDTDITVTTAGPLTSTGTLTASGAAVVTTTLGVGGLITCDDITAAADAATPAAGASSTGGFNFTPGGVTEASSGTHALLAGMTVNPLAVTNHASGTTTTMATLHLDGVPTHTGTSFTNTYSLWCGGANGTTIDGRIGGAIISGGTF